MLPGRPADQATPLLHPTLAATWLELAIDAVAIAVHSRDEKIRRTMLEIAERYEQLATHAAARYLPGHRTEIRAGRFLPMHLDVMMLP